MSLIDFEETGEQLVNLIRTSKAENGLRPVREKYQVLFDRQLETKKIMTEMLADVVHVEERVGQILLDKEEQKSQTERKLESLELELCQHTARSLTMDSELQFLQRELETLRDTKQELQELQLEVDEDTTEVIPSAIYIAQLYHQVTKIKWQHDTEPHILKGVHYGADLATPIHMDTSVRSRCEVSDNLWAFVTTEW